ncbi:MAG: DNA-binding transcriptional regulator [Pirellulales bacterium]|nr:DNA-binding transcriptional regulator [Pirellulales bacterium]
MRHDLRIHRAIMAQPYRIVLLLFTYAKYDRALLRGVARYARLHGPWAFYLSGEDPLVPLPQVEAFSVVTLPPEHLMGRRRKLLLPNLSRWRATGIIGRIQTAEITSEVLRSELPLITMDLSAEQLQPENPLSKTSEIRPDSPAAGRLAAEHFLERGFQRFAYCGYAGRLWSERRQEGFSQRLEEACFSCEVYDPPRTASRQIWSREWPLLRDWLLSLQKPVGIMACNDIRGRQILDACILSGLKVPEEVAVIGVDDDDLLCDLAGPPLSSVTFNAEQGGYLAAEHLAKLMAGNSRQPELIIVEPLRVNARRSTDVVAVEDASLAAALKFIRENYRRSIGVEDVVEQSPLSRRTLEIRFQRCLGRGIREEIQRARLNLVQQFLVETNLPLWKIAEIAGFNQLAYLSRVFGREVGMTLLQYRRKHRKA